MSDEIISGVRVERSKTTGASAVVHPERVDIRSRREERPGLAPPVQVRVLEEEVIPQGVYEVDARQLEPAADARDLHAIERSRSAISPEMRSK